MQIGLDVLKTTIAAIAR